MTAEPKIAQVVFGLPLEGHFDYVIPDHCAGRVKPGVRIVAVFARRKRVGIVIGMVHDSAFPKLNTLIKVLDDAPVFSAGMLDFLRSFADYFGCALGEALWLALPAYLRLPRLSAISGMVLPPLAAEERIVGETLLFAHEAARRWEILAEPIRKALAADLGVLVLVSDASLLEDVLPRLAPLAAAETRVLLRQATDKDEHERWRKVRSGQARLVVGFLSAVFAPVQDLGLIVVLDEESHFYKSEQSPFYHARDAARLRAKAENASIVFVSGAPSLTLMREVREGRITCQEETAPLAPVRYLDLGNFKMKKGTTLSPVLSTEIEKVIGAGGQVLLYTQAARGSAPVLSEGAKRFPSIRFAGCDRHTKVFPSEAQVIVGTQSVLRYRKSFRPALTAILDLDWEMHKNDVQAAHNVFALMRSLRQMSTQRVVVQTRNATAALLPLMAQDDAAAFYDAELDACRSMGLPPYGVLAAVVLRSVDPLLLESEAQRLYGIMTACSDGQVDISDPHADRVALLRGKFRQCIMIRGAERTLVLSVVRQAFATFRARRGVVVTVNLNP